MIFRFPLSFFFSLLLLLFVMFVLLLTRLPFFLRRVSLGFRGQLNPAVFRIDAVEGVLLSVFFVQLWGNLLPAVERTFGVKIVRFLKTSLVTR